MRQRAKVTVACPIEDAFAFVADPRNLPAWVDPVDGVQLVDDEVQIGEGLRFEQQVTDQTDPEGAAFTGTLVEHAPPHRVRFRFETETGRVATTFAFEEAPEGTRVTETLEVPLTRWSTKLLAPMLWLANRGRLKDQLAGLQAALERPPPGD